MNHSVLFKLSLVALSMISLMASTSAAGRIEKTAIIDIQRLFNEFHLTQIAKEKIQKNTDIVQKEVQEKVAEMQELKGKVENLAKKIKDPVTSTANKKELQREYALLINKGKALEKNRLDWTKRRETALKQSITSEKTKIMSKIQEQVDAYARENGIEMILDKSAKGILGNPFISYAEEQFEITNAVLEILNKDAKPAEEPQAEAVAPNEGDTSNQEAPPVIEEN